jgi:hypothetical protein
MVVKSLKERVSGSVCIAKGGNKVLVGIRRESRHLGILRVLNIREIRSEDIK